VLHSLIEKEFPHPIVHDTIFDSALRIERFLELLVPGISDSYRHAIESSMGSKIRISEVIEAKENNRNHSIFNGHSFF
jgi:hypothetical protein